MRKLIWSGNRKWGSLLVAGVALFAALALVATILTPTIVANGGENRTMVFDRDSVVYGRTYSEWSSAWEQWADSIPTANHPLFDNGDCGVGQSGPVWFLGGKFIAIGGTGSFDNVVRNCKVPYGKALYVAVFNTEDSVLEETGLPSHLTQIGELRAATAAGMEGATSLSMEVDGMSIPRIRDKFRVQSSAFVFTLPDDDFFTAVGEGPFAPGSYYPAVDDGYYVMLQPLPMGHHTVHFHGASGTFVLDITYHIYVH